MNYSITLLSVLLPYHYIINLNTENMKFNINTINTILGISSLSISCINAQNSDNNQYKSPNVVLFLVDDYGWNDLSCTGSSFYETPNIDRIAKQGTMFVNNYAACSVSSPSRASILTGKTPARHGITNWIGDSFGVETAQKNNTKIIQPQFKEQLPTSETTLVKSLKENGYSTFIAGKWHLGNLSPLEYGFDVNKGGWEQGRPDSYFSPYNNPVLKDGPAGEDLTLRLAKETVSYINSQSNSDKPFFAFLSFYAVHSPIQTTQEKWSYFRDKAEKKGIADSGFIIDRTLPVRQTHDNPVYAGLISSLDDAVGMVLDELERLNMTDNTIIVFTSDNGGVSSGDNYSSSNLPLRGGKGRQWEGGTRVPMFIMAPGNKLQGKKVTTPSIHMDIYPTILDLANIPSKPKQHIDGVSLKPLIYNNGTINNRALFWHYPHYGNQGGEPAAHVREGDWKLIKYWEDSRIELYNLKNDIGEINCIANKYPKKVKELEQKLNKWLKETGASIPEINKNFDLALYKDQLIKKQTKQLNQQEKLRLNQLTKDWKPNNNWWGSQLTID